VQKEESPVNPTKGFPVLTGSRLLGVAPLDEFQVDSFGFAVPPNRLALKMPDSIKPNHDSNDHSTLTLDSVASAYWTPYTASVLFFPRY